MQWAIRLHPLAIVVLLLTSGPVVADAPRETVQGVQTMWPIESAGPTTITDGSGAALLRPTGPIEGNRLQAEEVVIDQAWERGVETRGGSISLAKVATDEGRDAFKLEEAEVRFERIGRAPTFFAFSEGPIDLAATALDGLTFRAGEKQDVLSIGATPQEFRAGDPQPLGFWYSLDAPHVHAHGGGTVRIEGSFTLFVHDLRITANGKDGSWSDWTGYWESEPDRSVTEYDFRITKLHVTNGTFVGAARDEVGLYMASAEAHVDGSVATFGATGRLMQGDETHIFDHDPLRLDGKGNVVVRADTRESSRGAGAPLPPTLLLDSSGPFEVMGASSVEFVDGGQTTKSPALAVASWATAALVASMGMMALGVVPAPIAAGRRRQHAMWMRRGRHAADLGDWARASRCYKRATRMRRDEPMAWYEWAHSELERGHGELADALARRAGEVPGSDPFDLLDLRAMAAWERGDSEAFEAHLAALAKEAPAMARGLVVDLGVDPCLLGSRVAGLLAGPAREEGLDGYA